MLCLFMLQLACHEGDTLIGFIMTSGMDKEGGADTLSSPPAGGTGRTSSDEDAGPRALQGAKERGLQEGQEDPEQPPSPRRFGHKIRRLQRPSPSKDEEEEEEDESSTRGGKKRMASSSLEAESPKRGKSSLPEASTTTTNSSPQWDPRAQPLGKS